MKHDWDGLIRQIEQGALQFIQEMEQWLLHAAPLPASRAEAGWDGG